MLQYVAGSSWEVNYYSQVLNADNALTPQQTDLSPVYQQYVLVEKMELKVNQALTETQDPESKEFTTTGSATTYPRFIPNKGDMFLADIGDGREGVFAVTKAEKRTHLTDSLYVIEYELVGFNDVERRADFARKTIKKFLFVKEFLHYGQNPQIVAEDLDDIHEFSRQYRVLLAQYLHDFFSVERQTLLIPGQSGEAYDPFLTRNLLDWVSTEDHPMIGRIRQPNVAGDQAFSTTSVWEAIRSMDEAYLWSGLHQANLLYTEHFRLLPLLSGIHYSGIEFVVYPTEGRTDVDAGYEPESVVLGQDLRFGGRRYKTLDRLLGGSELNGLYYTVQPGQDLPDIVPVTKDGYYVFTSNFYHHHNDEPLSSNLERLVWQGLRHQPLDKTVLMRLCKSATKWENLERFYYTPALLALLKIATRSN